ncbi:MAG: TonB C-terminal domain-containing protein [Gammaproteobacteria bacterium]
MKWVGTGWFKGKQPLIAQLQFGWDRFKELLQPLITNLARTAKLGWHRFKGLLQPLIANLTRTAKLGWHRFKELLQRIPPIWWPVVIASAILHMAAVSLLAGASVRTNQVWEPFSPYLETIDVRILAPIPVADTAVEQSTTPVADAAASEPPASSLEASQSQLPVRTESAESLIEPDIVAVAPDTPAVPSNQPDGESELRLQVAADISRVIKSHWKVPFSAVRGLRAQVEVQLNREGKLVQIVFVRPSGSESFDASILRSLRLINSFPAVALLSDVSYHNDFQTIVLVFDSDERLRL